MKYLLLIENCLGLIFGFVFLMNFGIVFYSLYLEICLEWGFLWFLMSVMFNKMVFLE